MLVKVTFFQKVWCSFLITQKLCRKLSWKRDFEIGFCLESANSNYYYWNRSIHQSATKNGNVWLCLQEVGFIQKVGRFADLQICIGKTMLQANTEADFLSWDFWRWQIQQNGGKIQNKKLRIEHSKSFGQWK